MKIKSKLFFFSGLICALGIQTAIVSSCAVNNNNNNEDVTVPDKPSNSSNEETKSRGDVSANQLGLFGFIDDNWPLIDAKFIFQNKDKLLTSTKLFTSENDIVAEKIKFLENNNDPTSAVLSFTLKAGKSFDKTLEASKEPTEFQVNISGFVNILGKAKANAIQLINQSKFIGVFSESNNKKPKASEYNVSQLKTLPPEQNFGFKTIITDNNKNNDNDGTKSIKITVEKNAKNKETFDLLIDGFLTDKQYLNETTIPSRSVVDSNNDGAILTNTKNPNAIIDESLSEQKINELVDLKKTIFKKSNKDSTSTPTIDDFKIKFQTIEAWKIGGLSVGIKAQFYVQLTNQTYDWHSQTYDLYIKGFNEVEAISQSSLIKWSKVSTVMNAVIKTKNVFASSIKNKSDLDKLISDNFKTFKTLNNKDIQVELIDVLANTANDYNGSIKAIFRFKWKDNPEFSSVQITTVYGFSVK